MFVLAVLTFLVGCAGSDYRLGENRLRQQDYEAAVEHFTRSLDQDPQRPEVWHKLGRALFHLERYDEALQAFKQAALLDPDDARSVLYRGMIHEKLNEFDQARRLYQTYLSLGKDDKLTAEIKHRLRWVEDERLQRIIKDAVAAEQQVDVAE
jgi:Flp pilus assembly protein TadD